MNAGSLFKRLSLSLFVIVCAVGLTFADTIRLKDGSLIKGKIVTFSKGKFTVVIGSGSHQKQMTFLDSEVDSIEFEQLDQVTNRNASYTPEETRPAAPPKVITTEDPSLAKSSTPAKTAPAPTVVKKPATADAKPISWSVKVLADNTANGWTNTGFVVRKGQRVRISADGKVSLGNGKMTTASGDPDIKDDNKLLKNVATGAMIAVIGDDNNDFIYVGSEREFTATRDGALFLGINEGNLDDNSGSLSAKIDIYPDGVN